MGRSAQIAALAAAGLGKAARPMAGETPASRDVTDGAGLPGRNAAICCRIALIVGWANSDTGTDPALEVIEKTRLEYCRPLIKLWSGMAGENAFLTSHFQVIRQQSSWREHWQATLPRLCWRL